MFNIPKTQKAIRSRIRSYERSLKKEKEEYGYISDGSGKRYLLGPLYLLLDDLEGALESFAWFEQEFSDDSGEPFQYLCWSLALYKTDRNKEAKKKVAETLLQNPYLVPHLLGEHPSEYDIWHFSNLVELEYARFLPPEFAALWDADSLLWLNKVYHSEFMQKILQEFIDIHKALKTEPVGPKRSQLVERASGLLQFKKDL